jgi:hypothetical protein
MERMKWVLVGVLLASMGLNAYWMWSNKSQTAGGSSSRAPVVMRTPGGLLEVSTITAEERFESTVNHTILGVPVGKTVALIRVPTVYRYHVELAKEWKFADVGGSLVVVAPRVQPSLPVAINLAGLQGFSAGVWAPLFGAGQLAALQKAITPALDDKAKSDQMINLQREAARKTVTEFVEKWVLVEPRWKGLTKPTVMVFFSDEPLGQKAAPLLKDL